MSKPNILFIDIETLPNITYAYNLFDYKKPNMIVKEKAIITFAYKFNSGPTQVVTNYDFPHDKFDPYDDRLMVEFINEILSKADYVVAHYGDKFDMRFIRGRAAIHGLPATPIVATLDTYKLAKKYLHLNAYRLDYLGKLLGLGGKADSSWALWEGAAQGDLKAIKKMAYYNKRDVDLLADVFARILPHCPSTLNQKLFSREEHICPTCGSNHLQKRGTIVTKLTKRQRFACLKCGAWHSTKLEK